MDGPSVGKLPGGRARSRLEAVRAAHAKGGGRGSERASRDDPFASALGVLEGGGLKMRTERRGALRVCSCLCTHAPTAPETSGKPGVQRALTGSNNPGRRRRCHSSRPPGCGARRSLSAAAGSALASVCVCVRRSVRRACLDTPPPCNYRPDPPRTPSAAAGAQTRLEQPGEILTWVTPPSSLPLSEPALPPRPRQDALRAALKTAAPVFLVILERINSTIDWLSCTWRGTGTEGNQWSA